MRLERGLTVREFGNLIGAGKSLVSRWERGIGRPNPSHAKSIADFAGVSVDELLNPEISAHDWLNGIKLAAKPMKADPVKLAYCAVAEFIKYHGGLTPDGNLECVRIKYSSIGACKIVFYSPANAIYLRVTIGSSVTEIQLYKFYDFLYYSNDDLARSVASNG